MSARKTSRELLKKMLLLVASVGVTLLLVELAFRVTGTGDRERTGATEVSQFDDQLGQPDPRAYFLKDIHWTSAGHALASELIAERILPLLEPTASN